MRSRTFLLTICLLALIANSHYRPGASAQEPQKRQDESEPNRVLLVPSIVPPPPVPIVARQSAYPLDLVSEMVFERMVVKGAAFAADVINESVQILTDGNRIVNSTSGNLYRDGEGRTRVERPIPLVRAQATGQSLPRFITISDPVGGQKYALQPNSQTAIKSPFAEIGSHPNSPGIVSDRADPAVVAARIKAARDASESARASASGQKAIPADRTINIYGAPEKLDGPVLMAQVSPSSPGMPAFVGRRNRQEP